MNGHPAADEDLSSPPSDISSPPSSPPQIGSDSITVAPRRSAEGVVHSASASSAQLAASPNPAAQTANAAQPTPDAEAASKPKRQRKPRESKDAKPTEPAKEKKTRKPREPKIKKETGDAPAAAPRKRQKVDVKPTSVPPEAAPGPRQPTILEMVNQNQPVHAPYQSSSLPPPRPQPSMPSESLLRSSLPPHTSNPPTPRPYSSGQNYDPIRGSTIDAAPSRPPVAVPANGVLPTQASQQANRASASPSIISLIDPPQAATKPVPSQLSYSMQTASSLPQHQHPHQAAPPPPFITPQHSPPQQPAVPRSPPQSILPSQHSPPAALSQPVAVDGAMDVDKPPGDAPSTNAPPEIKISSKSSSSTAPTPKPAPAKASSPPKATGSGLLSSSDLLGGPSSSQGGERKGVDIEIRIQLNPQGGNTINIAQEIAKKYGRDAVNPRAAAHRERLLQVAAAANRLDGGSADDMSVDLMSEAEGDSNVEMGGMDEEKSATGADEKPKKRRRKVEEYDKEDDFIDDTELAWQQQAAVAKDGFFVYSGPLVPEGQNAQVESTTSTRGRGSGRGRGRGRAAAAAAAAAANGVTHASLAEKKEVGTTGRGRGRGRGTGATRKPRVTKADRERADAERAEKERAAAAANGGPTQPTAGPPVLPSNAVPHAASGSGPPQNTYGPQIYAQGVVPV